MGFPRMGNSGCALAMLACAIGLSASRADATPILVPNFSFESADTGDDGTAIAANWTFSQGGVYDPSNEAYSGATGNNAALPAPAHGGQVGWSNVGIGSPPGAATSAASLASITPSTQYTLTVAIGNRLTIFNGQPLDPGLVFVELLANGVTAASNSIVGSAITGGAFADVMTSFTTSALDPRVGTALTIRIRHVYSGPFDAQQANYDNVRLDAEAVPEPASSLVLSAAALAMLRRRGR